MQINEQWGLYDGYSVRDAKALRPAAWQQHMGRSMPIMNVIPPGLDFSNLKASDCSRCLVTRAQQVSKSNRPLCAFIASVDVARVGMGGAQVELPEDPNLKGFIGSKPEFVSRKSASRRASVDAEEKKEEIVEAGMAPPPVDNHAATSDAGTPRSERT